MCSANSISISICRIAECALYEKGKCTPDWAGPAMPKSRSAGLLVNDHVFFPVRLDGRKITATIDTGAQRTTLSAATARAMGTHGCGPGAAIRRYAPGGSAAASSPRACIGSRA